MDLSVNVPNSHTEPGNLETTEPGNDLLIANKQLFHVMVVKYWEQRHSINLAMFIKFKGLM